MDGMGWDGVWFDVEVCCGSFSIKERKRTDEPKWHFVLVVGGYCRDERL